MEMVQKLSNTSRRKIISYKMIQSNEFIYACLSSILLLAINYFQKNRETACQQYNQPSSINSNFFYYNQIEFINIIYKDTKSMRQFLYLILLAICTQSIFLPLKSNYPRCLNEFKIGNQNDQHKIMLNFPLIDDVQPGEHFVLTMKNTEDDKIQSQIIRPGQKIRKEYFLEPSIIYELCIHLKSERSLDLLIQYDSQERFTYEHTQIKLPDSLLTKGDFKGAYISAAKLSQTIDSYKIDQDQRKKQQKSTFIQTDDLSQTVTFLSGLQIVIVVAAGLYQFFTLKSYLCSKQYI